MNRKTLMGIAIAGALVAGRAGYEAVAQEARDGHAGRPTAAGAVDHAAVAAAEAAETMEFIDLREAGDANYVAPRTSWGDPDLQGVWPINHLTGVPLQRDPSFGERRYLNEQEMQARTAQYAERSQRLGNEVEGNQLGMGHWVEWGQLNNLASLIVDPPNGQLPALTAEGERRRAEMRSGWEVNVPFDHYEDFDNWDRCITRGLPASMLPSYYNAGIQILQSPGWVAIRLEMIHEVRLVRLEGEPVDADSRAWLGYSTGRWEGDTLVIETRNFNGKGSSTNIHTIGSPPYNNSPISHEYVLTERIKPTGPDTMLYTATVHDPVIWTADWTVELPWVREDDYFLYEYACAEDNVMIRNYINSSRAERGLIPVEGE
jgi:hypothetical protein